MAQSKSLAEVLCLSLGDILSHPPREIEKTPKLFLVLTYVSCEVVVVVIDFGASVLK